MKTLIYTCMLTLGVVSCVPVPPSNDGNVANSKFIGAWIWTNTDGGFGNHIHHTPVSEEKTIQLNVMKNNQFSIIENGNKKSIGTYDITLKKSIYSGKMDNFINFHSHFTDGIIKTTRKNQLTISDNYPDGIITTFTKIK